MSDPTPVVVDSLEGGAVWRATLSTPKANILDIEKTRLLDELFARAATERGLKAVLLTGAGDHFSFGASVQEHLPEQVVEMLTGFHGLFRRMLRSRVITVAAVRGQCLGGALELASFCHRVFASGDARLGQPEIQLGVFAPVASVTLVERVGRGVAEDLCLTGRSLTAAEALAVGLIDELADDPAEAGLEWIRRYLLPRSASSLRLATHAIRMNYGRRFRRSLTEVEELYLKDLMATRDAHEGLAAFLERREPEWRNS